MIDYLLLKMSEKCKNVYTYLFVNCVRKEKKELTLLFLTCSPTKTLLIIQILTFSFFVLFTISINKRNRLTRLKLVRVVFSIN